MALSESQSNKQKHVHLFYYPECEDLARNVAAQSSNITLQTIKWRSFFPSFLLCTLINLHVFHFLLLVSVLYLALLL